MAGTISKNSTASGKQTWYFCCDASTEVDLSKFSDCKVKVKESDGEVPLVMEVKSSGRFVEGGRIRQLVHVKLATKQRRHQLVNNLMSQCLRTDGLLCVEVLPDEPKLAGSFVHRIDDKSVAFVPCSALRNVNPPNAATTGKRKAREACVTEEEEKESEKLSTDHEIDEATRIRLKNELARLRANRMQEESDRAEAKRRRREEDERLEGLPYEERKQEMRRLREEDKRKNAERTRIQDELDAEEKAGVESKAASEEELLEEERRKAKDAEDRKLEQVR